jgi:predicted enzyme related to lactoylglutathione lyase
MAERTRYAPGTFCWTDLTTTDQEAAKAFYTELFGWTAVDNPVGDGVYYSMMEVDGKPVAGVAPQPEQQREAGVPPNWNSYISVQSADDALERAKALGATVHAPAFDVMDVGRMGVVQDPQGAFFLVWQATSHIGARLVNGPGLLSWNELASPDVDASLSFYSGLFGWTFEAYEDSDEPYYTIKSGGQTTGGIRAMMPAEPQPFWLVYFGAEDVESSFAKVEQLGGTKLAGPIAIGAGTLGFLQDPQSAVFALYAGLFEP